MSKPFVSRPRASSISTGILFLGLAVVAYFGVWWPSVMLAIGLSLVVRQLLIKKFYDALLSAVVFGGIYATVTYRLEWLPVIFVIAGIYLLFRAAQNNQVTEIEEEEETQQEIEETTKR